MLLFRKFEFTPDQWDSNKPLIQVRNEVPGGDVLLSWDKALVDAVAVLPPICLAWEEDENGRQVCKLYSDKVVVDILFKSEIPSEFLPFIVWPAPGGVHSFAGLDHLYEEAYNQHLAENE